MLILPGARRERGVFAVGDYGPRSDGVGDDMPAFRRCVDACVAARGGKVVVDCPLLLTSAGGAWDGATLTSNLAIEGRGDGSVINVQCPSQTPMQFSNFDLVTLRDLVFLGSPSDLDDCGILLALNASQTIIDGCNFTHVSAVAAVLYYTGGTNYIVRSKFGGSAINHPDGLGMIAAASGGANLIMDMCEVIDYGNVLGFNHSGKTNNNKPWVWFRGNAQPTGAITGTSGVDLRISNTLFDEGRRFAVDAAWADSGLAPLRSVILDNVCLNNHPGTLGDGGGLNIAGVDSFEWSGGELAWNPALAAKLRNVRHARFSRVKNYTGTTSNIDTDSTVTYLEVLECPGLAIAGTPGLVVHKLNGVDV